MKVLFLKTYPSSSDGNRKGTTRTCPFCQSSGIPLTMKFCIHCGRKLSSLSESDQIICQNCTYSNPPNYKYCAHCGSSLLIETLDLDRKGISKPAREYYLSSDGRFTKEKGGIFSEYLPALSLLMIWSLSLFVFIGGFLLLAGVGLIDPDSDSSNMLLQLFSSLALIVVLISPPMLSRFNLSRHSIGLEEKADFALVGRSYLVLTLISVILSLVLNLIMQLLRHFTESKREEVTPYPSIGFDDPGFLILWVLVAVIVGPIYEEILARGYLIPLLEKRGCSPTIAILASSAIFSGLHLQADLMAMV
ncbi:hypothetical protein ES703_94710 [subsurface metagenome]